MILLPWYLFAIACMASFSIAWILLSMLISGVLDDRNRGLRECLGIAESAKKEAAEWKTLAELYHNALHKKADKVHAERLAEIESCGQKDDYIDWSKIKKRDGGPADWPDRDYVFIEKDGTVNIQSYEPTINEEEESGWNTCVPIWTCPEDAIIGPLPQWRDSLRKRPGK